MGDLITGSGEYSGSCYELLTGSIDAQVAQARHAGTGKTNTFADLPTTVGDTIEVYSGGTQERPNDTLARKAKNLAADALLKPLGISPPKFFRVIERRWLQKSQLENVKAGGPARVKAHLDIFDASKCPSGTRPGECSNDSKFATVSGELVMATSNQDCNISYEIKEPEVTDNEFNTQGPVSSQVKSTLLDITKATSDDEIEWYQDHRSEVAAGSTRTLPTLAAWVHQIFVATWDTLKFWA